MRGEVARSSQHWGGGGGEGEGVAIFFEKGGVCYNRTQENFSFLLRKKRKFSMIGGFRDFLGRR
jgi:hypothetical protein